MSRESEKYFHVETDGGAVVVMPKSPAGPLDSDRARDHWEEVCQLVRDAPEPGVVVDLKSLDYFGSTMLDFFVTLRRKCGKPLVLCNAAPGPTSVLKAAKFTELYPLLTDRNAAVAEVAKLAAEDDA